MGGGGETVTLTEFLRFCGQSPKSGGTVGSCRRLWFTNWGRSELRLNLWGSKLGWHLGKEAVRFSGGNGDSAVTSAGLCPTSGLGHVQCSALRLLLWLVLRLLKRLSASSSASSRIGTGLNRVQFCEGSIWGEIWKYTDKSIWRKNDAPYLFTHSVAIFRFFFHSVFTSNKIWRF